jgi:hypothetical protein
VKAIISRVLLGSLTSAPLEVYLVLVSPAFFAAWIRVLRAGVALLIEWDDYRKRRGGS